MLTSLTRLVVPNLSRASATVFRTSARRLASGYYDKPASYEEEGDAFDNREFPEVKIEKFERLNLNDSAGEIKEIVSNQGEGARGHDEHGKASVEQLAALEQIINKYLPQFFEVTHPFHMYTENVVFIDNIRKTKITGRNNYMLRLYAVRFYYNVRYFKNAFKILNMVSYPEESFIKVRWRIITRPGFFRYALMSFQGGSDESWTDAISTLHVNKDGLIYCHICDNMDAEVDELSKKQVKNPLMSRGIVGDAV